MNTTFQRSFGRTASAVFTFALVALLSTSVRAQQVTWGASPANPDFESISTFGAPPDSWSVQSGTWGTDLTTTSTSYTGNIAVVFLANHAASTIASQLVAVHGGEQYAVEVEAEYPVSSVGAVVGVHFYDSIGGASLASSNKQIVVSANTWTETRLETTAPNGARYAEVYIAAPSALAYALNVDSVAFYRVSLQQERWHGVGPAGGFGTEVAYENGWNTYGNGYGQVGFRINTLGNLEFKGMALAPSPAPANYATVFTLPVGYRPSETRLVRLNFPGVGPSDLQVLTDGRVTLQTAAAGYYLPLDGVSVSLN